MEESPFLIHRSTILRQDRLQALVLHLYNCDDWPFNLGNQLTQLDSENLAIAFALMRAYHQHGENDPDFLDLGSQLANYQIERRRQFDAELDEEARRDAQD